MLVVPAAAAIALSAVERVRLGSRSCRTVGGGVGAMLSLASVTHPNWRASREMRCSRRSCCRLQDVTLSSGWGASASSTLEASTRQHARCCRLHAGSYTRLLHRLSRRPSPAGAATAHIAPLAGRGGCLHGCTAKHMMVTRRTPTVGGEACKGPPHSHWRAREATGRCMSTFE